MNDYAIMLPEGYGIIINKEEASKYNKMAVDLDNIDAIYNYALMLLKETEFQFTMKKHQNIS